MRIGIIVSPLQTNPKWPFRIQVIFNLKGRKWGFGKAIFCRLLRSKPKAGLLVSGESVLCCAPHDINNWWNMPDCPRPASQSGSQLLLFLLSWLAGISLRRGPNYSVLSRNTPVHSLLYSQFVAIFSTITEVLETWIEIHVELGGIPWTFWFLVGILGGGCCFCCFLLFLLYCFEAHPVSLSSYPWLCSQELFW